MIKPKISVIIPVYNTKQYLSQCVESLLKQTLVEFEAIFVDDSSTDGSYEFLLEISKIDNRIKVIKNVQKGVSYARYHGCLEAKADYIQFLDSDDWLSNDALCEVYNVSTKYKFDICNFQFYNYDENKSKIIGISSGIVQSYLPQKECFSRTDCNEKIFQLGSANLWSKCYRKDFIIKYLNFAIDLKRTEDYPVSYYSSLLAKNIIYLPKPLYYYRRNRCNSLESSKDNYPIDFYIAFKLLYDKILSLPFYEEIKRSYINCCLEHCIYQLFSKKTDNGYIATYNFLKNNGFKNLGIECYEREYYYNKKSYNIMYFIINFESVLSKDDLNNLNLLLNSYDKKNHNLKSMLANREKELEDNKRELSSIKKVLASSKRELSSIKKGYSFRIGRIITYLPRKVRDKIKYYKKYIIHYINSSK